MAVLRVRGAPPAIGPAPWWQTGAGALRDGLRERRRGASRGAGRAAARASRSVTPRGLPTEVRDDFRAAGLSPPHSPCRAANLRDRGRRGARRCCGCCGPTRGWRPLLSAAALLGFVVLARPSPSVLRAAVMGARRAAGAGARAGRGRRVPALGRRRARCCCSSIRRWRPTPGSACRCWPPRRSCCSRRGGRRGCGGAGCRAGLAEALAVPAAACLVTAPLVAGLSGSVSLVAVLANLLAAPAVAPATVLGRAGRGALAGVGDGWRSGVPGSPGPAVGWLVAVADRAAAVPGGAVPWPDGVAGAVLLAAVVLVLLVALARSRRIRALLGSRWSSACCWCSCPPGCCGRAGRRRAGPWWRATSGRATRWCWRPGRRGGRCWSTPGRSDGPVDACLDRLGCARRSRWSCSATCTRTTSAASAGALRGRAVGVVAVGPVREPRWALETRHAAGAAAGARGGRGTAPEPGCVWPGAGPRGARPAARTRHVDPDDGTAVNDGSLVLRADTGRHPCC